MTSAAALSAHLPSETRRQLERELDTDERLEWSAQPLPARLAKRALGMTLFGVPFTAFAFFWMAMASKTGGMFALFGIPFVCVGLFMLTAPLRAMSAATKTLYAITDRRAVIIKPESEMPFSSRIAVRSFTAPQLLQLERAEDSDGSGDLIFETILKTGSKGSVHKTQIGFLGISDVAAVEKRLRREVIEPSKLPSSSSSSLSSSLT